MAGLQICKMSPKDLDQVVEIENLSFPIPLSRGVLESELTQEASRYYVARADGKIIGFIIFWIVLDEAHLIDIAVHPHHRRKRVGSQLFFFMLEHNDLKNCRMIYLEVRPSNTTAIQFYEYFGFEPIGTRKEYYPDKEDALVMAKKMRG